MELFPDKYKTMLFYHYKRNYDYLNAHTYSRIEELCEVIIRSVEKNGKWLIFIDDKEKCQKLKETLEKKAKELKADITNGSSKERLIYAVSANSKDDTRYKSVIENERLGNDISVLITTSVLDNGVNFRDIDNVVIADISRAKCIQMVGRARVDKDKRVNLYVKRPSASDLKKRIDALNEQREAYHEYNLAYGDVNDFLISRKSDEYKFLHKYFDNSEQNCANVSHWFGRLPENPDSVFPNMIAKSMVENELIRLENMLREIEEEINASRKSENVLPGQKVLEYVLSWFGKCYIEANDVSIHHGGVAVKNLEDFLKHYADDNIKITKEEQEKFSQEFTQLYDEAFHRADKNKERDYGIAKINKLLKNNNLPYKVNSSKSTWSIVEWDWRSEKSE
jgi:superfamily II DNA or RNA helicase